MRGALVLPLLILITPFLDACSGSNHIDYLRMHDIPAPSIEHFTHCYNYGCKKRKTLAAPKGTLNKINALFENPSTSPEQEKKRIIQAIQIFETDIGAVIGTQNDKRGTFRLYQDDTKTARSFQQDCIDESTNTTIYLTLLNNMDYLKFYRPAFPASRQPFFNGNRWWHQTAVMQNKITGERFAVDSWFEDNGKAGYIVPLPEWKDGWKPKHH